MKLRHQLAAYSPLSLAACAQSCAAAVGLAGGAHRQLHDLLLKDYDAESAVLCGSGTQALQLAISITATMVYDSGSSRPLIAMPGFSCFDLASAAIGADAHVSLYDVDPRTLGPDPRSFERAIASGARIVVVAPLYGVPVDWDALEAIAVRYGAVLIEDAAQGFGASWRGRKLGTLGAISTLSFGRGKGWTGGGGGAVLLRRGAAATLPSLARPRRIKELKTAVGLAAQWMLGRPSTYGLPRSIPSLHLGETVYHPPAVPVAITAAAAVPVLENYDASVREAGHRRLFAASALATVNTASGLEPIAIPPGGEAGYLRLPFRKRAGGVGSLSSALRESGVERSYPVALGRFGPLSAHLSGPDSSWPGADCLVDELLTFPTHSRVTLKEIARFLAVG